MTIKSLVSPIALIAGLAMTSAAAAQTMVGGQDISDMDLPAVQEHCDTLDVGAGVDAGADAGIDADVDGDDAMVDGDVTAGADIDLDAITYQDCVDAGLIEDAGAGVDAGVDAGVETDLDTDMDTGVDADVDADLETETDIGL